MAFFFTNKLNTNSYALKINKSKCKTLTRIQCSNVIGVSSLSKCSVSVFKEQKHFEHQQRVF